MRLQFTKTTSEWTCETQFFVAKIVPESKFSRWQFFLNGEYLAHFDSLEETEAYAEICVLHCLSHQVETMQDLVSLGIATIVPTLEFCSFPRPAWYGHYRHWSLRVELENNLYRPYCASSILPLEPNLMMAMMSAEGNLHQKVKDEIDMLLAELNRRKSYLEQNTTLLQGGGHSKAQETPLLDI